MLYEAAGPPRESSAWMYDLNLPGKHAHVLPKDDTTA